MLDDRARRLPRHDTIDAQDGEGGLVGQGRQRAVAIHRFAHVKTALPERPHQTSAHVTPVFNHQDPRARGAAHPSFGGAGETTCSSSEDEPSGNSKSKRVPSPSAEWTRTSPPAERTNA